MTSSNHPGRSSKRSRVNDAVQDKPPHVDEDRVKRRRFSAGHKGNKKDHQSAESVQESSSQQLDLSSKKPLRAPWSLSHHAAGQYSNLDPIFTSDEEYLFLALETSVHVYSMTTSRLFRTLNLEPSHNVVGYRLCPFNGDHIYIFTSTGSVSKWEWLSGKRVWSWAARGKVTSVEIWFQEPEVGTHATAYFLRERKDGKREITIAQLSEKTPSEHIILEANLPIRGIKVAQQGQTILVYGNQHLLIGSPDHQTSDNSKSAKYTWREAVLPVNITCVDIRENQTSIRTENSREGKVSEPVDLVLGESNGSILIYSNISNFFLTHEDGRKGGESPAPRRLHWHRGPVNTVRWSRDGNYILSGGNESVMVIWQLDSGRKQFLPHLSSPICNIILSPSGTSYVIKLADNCVMALSARELQPFASIIGLQLYPKVITPRDKNSINACPSFSPAAAALHPRQPDQLLLAVPASRQVSQTGHHLANSSVLQTFDIRTNSHIARQALARTNATTLRISPEGSEIVAPHIKHLDVAQDGKWMVTTDTWSPYPEDVKALDFGSSGLEGRPADYQEVFLKFWTWNNSSSLWELVTRIDGPHFSDRGHVPVLSVASRPQGPEFATFGADGILRFWCPSIRQRSGLKTGPDAEQQMETWKCRSFIDLKGSSGSNKAKSLSAASLDYSDDGSVLAVCLPSQSASNPGLVVLVDAQNCAVHYSRTGLFWGHPCAAKFMGRHFVIASKHIVSIWDTVNDLVRTTTPECDDQTSSEEILLLAVNSRTQTFAIATQRLQNRSSQSTSKSRNTQFSIRVYDVQSLIQISQVTLERCPLVLLSSLHSNDYIVVDAAANVKRLGCSDDISQPTIQSRELSTQTNPGLGDLFGGKTDGTRSQYPQLSATVNPDRTAPSNKGLGSIFGNAPSFVLPPASVLFRDVVQSLVVG